MPRFRIICIALISLILFSASCAYAGGLSTPFIGVKLKDIKPGKTYNVEKVTGKPLIVTNTTDAVTMNIKIELRKPTKDNLVKGYKPIPKLSWVRIKKTYFKNVGPGESVKTRVLVSIPNRLKYRGKKYQFQVYSHTAGKETFSVGLMSRVLIKTKPRTRRRKIRRRKAKKLLDKKGD